MEKILTIDQRQVLRNNKIKAYYRLRELYPTIVKLRVELKKWEAHWERYEKIYADCDHKVAYSNHYEEMAKGKHKPMKRKEVNIDVNMLSDDEVGALISKLQGRFNGTL